MKIEPPWWFCNGWFSYWCVLDVFLHDVVHVTIPWVCNRHDQVLVAIAEREWESEYADGEPVEKTATMPLIRYAGGPASFTFTDHKETL